MQVSIHLLFHILAGRGQLLPIKFLIQKKDQKVDIHFCSVKQLHDRNTFILQLQEILSKRTALRVRNPLELIENIQDPVVQQVFEESLTKDVA